MSFCPLAAAVMVASAFFTISAVASPLQLDVYNPGEKSIFPVTSTIVMGKHEAILVDAQFQRNDAQALVHKIKASGRKLKTIYISHNDPDYYFGLDVLHAAFPDAEIVATPQTVAAIKANKDGKVAYWGPILKQNAPKEVIVPRPLSGNTLTLEGETIKIIGLDGPSPDRTVLWIPSMQTILGGVPIVANLHVWVADTQTFQSRQDWLKMLEHFKEMHPKKVIPGHFLPDAHGKMPFGVGAIDFTRIYLRAFEVEAALASNSGELIAAMRKRYPKLAHADSLELSAKVIKGEMKWSAH